MAAIQTKLVQAQLENLRLQLQPHFLFNTLNTISSVMYGDVRSASAIRELVPWFHGENKVMLHDITELRWSRRYVSQRPELLKLP
jgi:LytS/YehU family sensor histidine kinase